MGLYSEKCQPLEILHQRCVSNTHVSNNELQTHINSMSVMNVSFLLLSYIVAVSYQLTSIAEDMSVQHDRETSSSAAWLTTTCTNAA